MLWGSKGSLSSKKSYCSFCGKSKAGAGDLIESPAAFLCEGCHTVTTLWICTECVSRYQGVVAQGRRPRTQESPPSFKLLNPAAN